MLVVAVGGGFELERRVLHVEVTNQASLHLVEQSRDVSVAEASVVDDDVSRQRREV